MPRADCFVTPSPRGWECVLQIITYDCCFHLFAPSVKTVCWQHYFVKDKSEIIQNFLSLWNIALRERYLEMLWIGRIGWLVYSVRLDIFAFVAVCNLWIFRKSNFPLKRYASRVMRLSVFFTPVTIFTWKIRKRELHNFKLYLLISYIVIATVKKKEIKTKKERVHSNVISGNRKRAIKLNFVSTAAPVGLDKQLGEKYENV